MLPPDRNGVIALLGAGMMEWQAGDVSTPAGAQRAFEQLADRVINYFAVHYAAPLPGLPGGQPLG